MVKARSLKHLRYVVVGRTSSDAILPDRDHYWCEGKKTERGGTWTEELGGATIFQDYKDARDFLNTLKKIFPDMVEKNNIKVEVISAKVAMVAKLKLGAENG